MLIAANAERLTGLHIHTARSLWLASGPSTAARCRSGGDDLLQLAVTPLVVARDTGPSHWIAPRSCTLSTTRQAHHTGFHFWPLMR
jgi:hypothetical protein